MKKFVLVPEAKHRQMMKIDSRDVLQSIKQPEQREMLKRYQLAQNILNDHQRSDDDTKMNEYREMMQDFSMLRDRQGHVQQAQQPTIKIDDDREKKDDDIDAAVVDALPNSQKVNAKKLIRLLRSHDVVSWTPQGDVIIRGQRLRGVNIVDLVGDVVRTTPSRSMPLQREQFLNALAQANVPETLVKNRMALEHYRAIKNDGARQDSLESTSLRQDELIPNVGKKRKVQVTEEDPIDWNAPL